MAPLSWFAIGMDLHMHDVLWKVAKTLGMMVIDIADHWDYYYVPWQGEGGPELESSPSFLSDLGAGVWRHPSWGARTSVAGDSQYA